MSLFVDGSLFEADGTAESKMVLRDEDGNVIFSAYRHLFYCNDALELEIHVMLEGITLNLQ